MTSINDLPALPGGLAVNDAVAVGRGGTAYSTLALALAATIGTSVQSLGAKGDGTTDDTAAIIAAYAGGGTIIWPAGSYVISSTILVPSNTHTLFAPGANILPRPLASFTQLMLAGSAFGYAIFANKNWQAGSLTDSNITFEDARCVVSGSWNGHFILNRMVSNLKILRPYGQNLGDVVASLGCKDVLVDAGWASGMSNCAWDFWEGPTNVTVRDCVAYNCVQGINFNATDTYNIASLVGQNLRAIGNRFFNIASAAIFISPLSAGSTLKNIECVGNYINQGNNPNSGGNTYSGIVSQRSQNVAIHHNVLEAMGVGTNPVNCSLDAFGSYGTDNRVDDNIIQNSAIGTSSYISAYGTGAKVRRNRAINSTGSVAVACNDASAVVEDNDLPGVTYPIVNANPGGGATTPAGRRYYNSALGVWASDQPLLLPVGPNPAPLKAYEEGPWTPVLQFGGASTGIVYSTQSGTYTRIGRLYFLTCFIVLTNKGSATGAATIAGSPAGVVPFASRFSVVYYANMPSLTQEPAAVISGGTIALEALPVAGGGTALTDANFTNATYLEFTGTFTAAS